MTTEPAHCSSGTSANLGNRPLFDKEAHRRNLQAAQDVLADELQTLIGDTEQLLRHTQDVATEQTDELRNRLGENLARARSLLDEHEASARNHYEETLYQAERYIHTRPWRALGVAAGAGFLLGMIIRR